MRTPFLLATMLALSAASGAAQTKLDVKDIQDHPFTADFNSGGKLRMYLRSGDFRIMGGDGEQNHCPNHGAETLQSQRHEGSARRIKQCCELDHQWRAQKRSRGHHRGAEEDRTFRPYACGKSGTSARGRG